MSRAGAKNEVFTGIIIDKQKLNKQMPFELKDVKILLIDDALEPEQVAPEALRTEAGFTRHLEEKEEFKRNIEKIIELGINLVLVDKNISSDAEEILTDAGVIAVERVSTRDLEKVAEHTGAKIMKRTGIKKSREEISEYVGEANKAFEDRKLQQIRIVGGKGKPLATILVGAATEEIVDERERIAKDAAYRYKPP